MSKQRRRTETLVFGLRAEKADATIFEEESVVSLLSMKVLYLFLCKDQTDYITVKPLFSRGSFFRGFVKIDISAVLIFALFPLITNNI